MNDTIEKHADHALDRVCPPRQWERDNICDMTILTYRYNLRVSDNQLVEVTLRYRVERCTEGYVLGDLLHSLTLLPGEEVLLSTRSRHSTARFTEDASFSASQVSRSTDRVWMETYQNLATDYDQMASGSASSSTHSETKQSGGGGGGGINLFGIIKIGGGGSTSKGTFDASSSAEFQNQLHQHLESSYHQTNSAVRDTASVSITEVNSHRESTSEVNDELKTSVRRFRNINQCHTVTHYFYQIAKRQRVKITFLGRTLRAINRFADTAVRQKPLDLSLASNALITKSAAVAAGQTEASGVPTGFDVTTPVAAQFTFASAAFAPSRLQNVAVKLDDLVLTQQVAGASFSAQQEDEKRRLEAVDLAGRLLERVIPQTFEIERVDIIPTEALYVESELGDCSLCEPYVMNKHELELERLRLENKLLEGQIALLEKHKDYRCCDGEEDDEG